jgi:uncharacterized protein (UPF0332 family)
MDARLYLLLARSLIARVRASEGLVSAAGPAECRSATSRAYYAAFHAAGQFLQSIGFAVTSSGACHVTTQYALNNSPDTELQTAATQLATLYSARRAADYDMGDAAAEEIELAKTLVELASKTVVLLDRCRGECRSDADRKDGIVSAIQAWARGAGQERNIWRR